MDWAIANRVPLGGWCPKGRRAEDGVISRRYRLRETRSREFSQRTRWNVRDSDGTVIISVGRRLRGGSALTLRAARELGRPVLHLGGGRPLRRMADRLRAFVRRNRIRVLNVAGPRVSGEPAVGALVYVLLELAFGRSRSSPRRSGQVI
jgi:hypothetical protein